MTDLSPKPKYAYSRGHRALEVVSIALLFATLISLGLRTADAVDGSEAAWPLGLSVVGGYVLADFISGVAHWAGDTVGDESTTFVGPRFVKPFREHHVDPEDITRHDFVEINGNSSIATFPLLLIVFAVFPSKAGWWLYVCVALASGFFFVFLTNQFHKWAHARRVPGLVRWLQRSRIILSPEHHAVHHASPHDKYYCITVGWLNPLLHHTGFFRACEAIVGRVLPGSLHLAERERPPARLTADGR